MTRREEAIRGAVGRPLRRWLTAALWVVLALSLAPAAGASEDGVAPAASAPRLAIIVSAKWVGAESLTLAELRNAYLGRIREAHGARLQPRHLDATSPAYANFLRDVLRMSAQEHDRHWVDEAVAGGARPFRSFRSLGGLLGYVARVRGAIGYVEAERLEQGMPPGIRPLAIVVGGAFARPSDPADRPNPALPAAPDDSPSASRDPPP